MRLLDSRSLFRHHESWIDKFVLWIIVRCADAAFVRLIYKFSSSVLIAIISLQIMVSISNGGLGEVSNKRPLENSSIPKYKPRRVSAVRDFPPQCGRNPIPPNIKPEEIRGSQIGRPQMAEIIGSQAIRNSEAIKTESNEVNTAEIPKLEIGCEAKKDTDVYSDLGSSGVKNSNNMVECESHEAFDVLVDVDMIESLDELVGKITSSANIDEKLSTWPPGFQLPNEVNNPIEVEMPQTMDMFVGKLTTTTIEEKEGFANSTEKLITYGKRDEGNTNTLDAMKTDSPNKETEATGQPTLNELNKVEILTLVKKSGMDFSVRGKDKYRKRSVSAVRDFPPNCGRNFSLPTEKSCPQDGTIKQITPTSQEKCLSGLQNNRTLQRSIIQETEMNDAGARDEDMREITNPVSAECAGEIVVYSPGKRDENIEPSHSASSSSENDENRKIIYALMAKRDENIEPSHSSSSSENEENRKSLYGLMAKPNCPWSKEKTYPSNNHDLKTSGGRRNKKPSLSLRHKSKAVAKKSIQNLKSKSSVPPSKKLKKVRMSNDDEDDVSPEEALPPADGEGQKRKFPTKTRKQQDLEVTLPPFGPNTSAAHGDARNKVRNTLRLFNAICRKLLQKEEANSILEDEEGKPVKNVRRIDLFAAKAIKEKGEEVNTGKQILGQVPGVLVGDEFQYRVELAVVGIHRLYQAGIDSMKLENGLQVATSIVSSGAYSDDLENADVLIYSGQGGNVVGKQKQQPQDQKLERGNLALKNSIDAKTPVRVVRGWRDKAVDPLEPKPKLVTTYVYDGLYTVERYWTETGPHGKQVFMFELRRNPGQPELAWKQLKKSNNARFRPGVCVKDISNGKEAFGIPAVNIINDEKPPSFEYVARMTYPAWHVPAAPPGCDCAGRCSDSRKCRCAVRNGGQIPYNRNGALVETKLLVYECGPHCKCPPSCFNRVTQRGIKYQLEIFKTETRGWGVRALTSIPSGSFICEYAGELLEDREAEKRIGSDEYLFDIGQNLSDSCLNAEDQALSAELVEDGGYTIDACRFGNVGRFVNHSCAPNLYAQNVIYDHDDMKMPHIMLFAMENIPPLQELTYHYNYCVDQIRDSHGNIKVKKCYCGAAQCTGRMY
ncbi:histone-lysine N-methyltransferase [Striga asiatica]|uniref:Histone-lysine N-methyltransferase n=1 Tax=Striga asiatica TaxID=4170 RepID=A0A5A7Q6K3_STRAF|nr:histone-lysine N-methyltransferase [Striga asiatica]